MIKKILLASVDDDVRAIMRKGCSSQLGEKNVQICKTCAELNIFSKFAEQTAIIFDKYFLGYVISYELIRLKTMNPSLLIYFAEVGNISESYAVRVCQYQVDGYICNVEDSANLQNKILNIKDGMKLVPADVSKTLKGMNLFMDGKCVSELSEREVQIAVLLGKGLTQKEIAYELKLTAATVSQNVTRIKKKIGYSSPRDFFLLNDSYWKNTGGEDACKA